MVSLEELKKFKTNELKDMQLFTCSRLSVQNVTDEEWDYVLKLEKRPAP
jgi:predicted RNA-binding protein with PUA-like domain